MNPWPMNTLDAEHKGEMGSRVGNGRSLEGPGAVSTAGKPFFGLPTRPIKKVNIQSIPMQGLVEK